jgi:hypothetical protein
MESYNLLLDLLILFGFATLVTIVRTGRVEHTVALESAGASQVVAAELSASREVVEQVIGMYGPAAGKEQVHPEKLQE